MYLCSAIKPSFVLKDDQGLSVSQAFPLSSLVLVDVVVSDCIIQTEHCKTTKNKRSLTAIMLNQM